MLAARGSIHIDHAILGSGGLEQNSPLPAALCPAHPAEQDLQHEELLAGYPERWGDLVRDICLSE